MQKVFLEITEEPSCEKEIHMLPLMRVCKNIYINWNMPTYFSLIYFDLFYFFFCPLLWVYAQTFTVGLALPNFANI